VAYFQPRKNLGLPQCGPIIARLLGDDACNPETGNVRRTGSSWAADGAPSAEVASA
jgi:hypothetical protein